MQLTCQISKDWLVVGSGEVTFVDTVMIDNVKELLSVITMTAAKYFTSW